MQTPDASYSQLRHTAASLGVHVTNQAIEQRFSGASARLARALLDEAVGQVISSEACAPELLGRFNGVYLQDGTVISLPASLAEQWQGSGKAGQEPPSRVEGPGAGFAGALERAGVRGGGDRGRKGGSQSSHHSSAQRLAGPSTRPAQTQGTAPWQA